MRSPSERNTSELLGVGADARLLIVNCDDFGIYPAVNLGIIEAITKGVATTCSLMTPCPGASQAIELLRQHPRIPFGIHLTVVCELPGLRWGPSASKAKVEPTHLDWHCLRDGGRVDVFELGVTLAREYGLALRAFDGDAQQRLRRS